MGKKTDNSPEAIAKRRKALGLTTDAPISVIEPQKLDAEATKRLLDLAKRTKNVATKRTAASKVAGDTIRTPVPFAGFKLQGTTYVTALRIRSMLIPEYVKKEGEINLDKAGRAGALRNTDTKPIQVAYGYKLKTRKTERKKRGGSKTHSKVIAWITLSVPTAATMLDVITWVQSFGKVPAIVRMNKKEQLLGKLMPNAGILS